MIVWDNWAHFARHLLAHRREMSFIAEMFFMVRNDDNIDEKYVKDLKAWATNNGEYT